MQIEVDHHQANYREDVPSTLVNQDASRGGITVLYRNSLHRFIDSTLHPPGRLGTVTRLISAPFR